MAHAVFYGAMSLDGYLADKEDGLIGCIIKKVAN